MNFISEQSKWSWMGENSYIPYRQTDDGELVLYDFNIQPGERYPSSLPFWYNTPYVTNVRRITTKDGISRRLLTLSNGYELLEGFGCLNSPGMLFCYLNPHPDMVRWEGIQLYYVLTFKGEFQNVEPLYNCDEREKELALKIKNNTAIFERKGFYDLQGRRLMQQPRKGVYIRGGRKVVVK